MLIRTERSKGGTVLDPIAAPNLATGLDTASKNSDRTSQSGGKPPPWTELVTGTEWQTYQSTTRALQIAGIPFLLGGAFGLAAYTGRWRNTKDLDLFLAPEDKSRAITVLN